MDDPRPRRARQLRQMKEVADQTAALAEISAILTGEFTGEKAREALARRAPKGFTALFDRKGSSH